MTPAEQSIADAMYAGVQHFSNFSNRSLQAKEFKVGVSDMGFCSERTRRMLMQEVPEDRDVLPAFIGTALGDHIEQAVEAVWPAAIRQATVSVTLHGDSQDYVVTGHPDLILPEGILLDVKTTRGLETVRRTGPSQQQQFQRHNYALGAWEGGLFDEGVELSDVQVGNVWMDRAGDDRELHVQMEPYDPEWTERAAQWLDEVVYAYLHGEPARKEPPREMCAKVCGFFDTCRALDTDVEGLLTDPTVLAAVNMDREGAALVREGYKLRDMAKPHLTGVSGSTGEFAVRWTHINATDVKFTREGYDRLDIKPLPKMKR